MQLEFLNKLDRSQLIDLVNYVLFRKDGELLEKHKTNQVIVFNESGRCDSNGNQEIYIDAWNGIYSVGSFLIQDFKMERVSPTVDYSKELREFMVSIFGNDYLDGLTMYYSMLASLECERLKKLQAPVKTLR